MFSQCLAQRFLYPGKKVPRLIVVQDFVVDAALELRMLNLPLLPHLLRWLERWSFEFAETLLTISHTMLVKLRAKVNGTRRCELVPNWIHRSLEDEIHGQNARPAGREPRTLFYSGNLGVKQGLPEFIQSFKQCETGWRMRVHGGGAELEAMRREISGEDAITLGDVLDEVDYVQALRTAMACLITQKSGMGANFLPSKLLPALATGTPGPGGVRCVQPIGDGSAARRLRCGHRTW